MSPSDVLSSLEEQKPTKREANCDFCRKNFATVQSMYVHRVRCKERPKDIDTLSRKLSELQEEVKLLRKSSRHPTQTTNHNITNNNQINLHFDRSMLRAFGEESMAHITVENFCKALEERLPLAGISQLIRSVPENQNIYHSNKQSKTLQVYNGQQFVYRETDQTYLQELANMLDRASALVEEYNIPRHFETKLLNWVCDLRDILIQEDGGRLNFISITDEDVEDKEEHRRLLRDAKATIAACQAHIHSLKKTVLENSLQPKSPQSPNS